MTSPVKDLLGAIDERHVIRFWCAGGCGLQVDRRNEICDPCALRESMERRRARLTQTIASLPKRDWARFGHPDFERLLATWPADLAKELKDWRIRDRALCLMGKTGKGKTVAVCAIANRIMDAALDPKAAPEHVEIAETLHYTKAARLAKAHAVMMMHGNKDETWVEAKHEIQRAERASVLIVDELGYLEFEHRTWKEIGSLLDTRYDDRKTTIVTTGCNEDQLAEHYGDATSRRILQGTHINFYPKKHVRAAS